MNELREKIFAWILKRQPARKVVMPQWNEIRRVVVLYPNGNIQHIIKQIENSAKEVVQFTLPDKKDINWLTKRPNSDVREQIMARHLCLDKKSKWVYERFRYSIDYSIHGGWNN